MHSRASNYAPALVVLAALAVAACDSNAVTTSDGLSGPTPFRTALITAEPATIPPQFQSSPFCPAQRPFDARLSVTVRPGHDLFVHGIGFEFLDRFGRRVAPFAIPTSAPGTTLSILPPIPLPTSLPIPIPGHVPFPGVIVSAGAVRTFPFALRFDCGVPAAGTLFIAVETVDRRGTADVSRITARIGN